VNKKFLLLGAGLFSALFAGTTATETPSVEQGAEVATQAEPGPQYVSRTFHTRKPAPTKPTSQPAPQQKVVVRQAPLASVGFTRFIEKPHLRKVKYGKHRWVLV
jgi:hypothetical protein